MTAGSPRRRRRPRQGPEGSGAADHPLRIDPGGWKAAVQRTQRRIVRDRVTMAAGSLAYYGFLAFFPAMIAALGLLSLAQIGPESVHHLTHGIAKALPAGTASVFDAAVNAATKRSSGSTGAVVIGVIVALWSASAAMSVLQQALDTAYEVSSDRKFLARRIRGLALLALTVLLGGAGAALIVFGQPIGSAIAGIVPIGGTAFIVVWTAVRWVVTLALITLLFSAYYMFAPNRESPRWQWVSTGGLVATAVFLLASLGFSFYVSSFGRYSETYGSLAGVAIFIFWLWLTGLAVLVGGELNAEIEREAARRAGGPGPSPASDPPAAGATVGDRGPGMAARAAG